MQTDATAATKLLQSVSLGKSTYALNNDNPARNDKKGQTEETQTSHNHLGTKVR